MVTWIVERKGFFNKKKLRSPLVLVGLPGVGMIGRVVAHYIIRKLNGSRFADIYSSHFPPQVFMQKNGRARIFRNSLYFVKGPKRDVFVLTGDVQPIDHEGHYEVSLKLLDYFVKRKVKEIVAVGGYLTGKFENDPSLYGVVNNLSLKKKLEKEVVFGEAKGTIVGMAGLLPALSRQRKIKGFTVLAQTHGGFVDVVASERVLRFLSKYIPLKIDLKDLERQAKEMEEMIKKIEEELKGGSKGLSYIR